MTKRRQQVVIWSLGLLVTAVMLGLGLWQAQAFSDSGREALVARMHEPPVPVTEVAPAGQVPGDAYGRTVEATGTYLPDQQLSIPDARDPARARVLTALRLADGSVVPVVRGVVASSAPVPAPPAGEVPVRGVLLPSEAEPTQELPAGQLGTVRLPRIAQLWPQPLVPGFVVLDGPAATAQGFTPAEVALPSNAGHARNQGYALQWWIFAAAAIAATVKLSRDSARGTGFMRTDHVDDLGKTVENSAELSTIGPERPDEMGESPSSPLATVDRPTESVRRSDRVQQSRQSGE